MNPDETAQSLPQPAALYLPVEVQSLKRGGIYALVFEHGLAERSYQHVKLAVDEAEARLGVKFLILDGGVRVVTVSKAEAKDLEKRSIAL